MDQEKFYKQVKFIFLNIRTEILALKNNGAHDARQKPVIRGRRCPSKPALVFLLHYLVFDNLLAFIKRSGLPIH